MTFKQGILAIALLWSGPVVAQEADLRLAVPLEMIESGFTQHLLPRFGFKTRIKVLATDQRGGADMAFDLDAGAGAPVFQVVGGGPVYLDILSGQEASEDVVAFETWLRSAPGRAAIEGFPAGGPPVYAVGVVEAAVEDVRELDGDVAVGSKLALLHCGRCHVVDARNPYGGIGSTPSFPALRGRVGWADLFLAFWAENPHPSFTQVDGVTEPFDDAHPSHITPMELTLEDIDAITAFVGTLEPKDLGAQVQSQ